MNLSKMVHRQTFMCICGIVVDNIQNSDSLNCYLQINTESDTNITVLYHSEFPPSQNIDAGDIAFCLQAGDKVELMAEIVSDNLLSICTNEACEIVRLHSNRNN